jgi:glycosyltransferase involved in cell wall biosynthesis
MKHLHFVQSTEPLEGGGLGRAAVELSAAMNGGPDVSRLITTRAGGDEVFGDVAAYGRSGPTRVFYAAGVRRDARGRVAEADVVHGHGFYVATNWLLGREARLQGKPLVYHAHGIFEPWILARSKWKKRVAHALFENSNFAYARLWRALTFKEADQIKAQGITAPVVVCPNGIALEAFEAVPNLRLGAAKVKKRRELLFLARLHPKKGLVLLIQAWADVPKMIRSDWRIVVAGPDELGHRKEVEAVVARLGLDEEVVFTGSVGGAAKLGVLASAEAFVLPSYSEGFSVAILEALACRLPVLATHACNFPDLATQGGGWCVESTVEGVREGLLALLSAGEDELRQRGEQGRGLVERGYTWPNIAAQLKQACDAVR